MKKKESDIVVEITFIRGTCASTKCNHQILKRRGNKLESKWRSDFEGSEKRTSSSSSLLLSSTTTTRRRRRRKKE